MSTISPTEFAERRKRAADAAQRQGLKGLLVCSRGGGALDRYGDVMYLSNFYSAFPFIPDVPGNWSLRGHGLLVLAANGDARLVIDCESDGTVALSEREIIRADLMAEATIKAMKELGLDDGPVGLVGGDTLPLNTARQIEASLSRVTFSDAQAILTALRAIKSPAEIALLRRASHIGSRMIEAMLDAARPGMRHGDVMAAGMGVLMPEGGALYNSFMAFGRGGEKPRYVASSFPTWKSQERMEKGDFFCAGISGMLDGYYFDMARSKAIGAATNAQVAAFETAIATVEAGVAAVRPGVVAEEIAREAFARQRSLGFPLTSDFSGMGHGIGLGWDAPWLAPGDKTILKPGMVLCIERTVSNDGYHGDFEETVLVTENGCEKITDARMRSW